MKIQEMRSGLSHLHKRMETERREQPIEGTAAAPVAVPQAHAAARATEACGLDQSRWAVISFDQIEAGGLTYRQAARLLNELEMNDVTGLCIVTDEAAKRMGR
jgi:hypothetical protein